MITLTAKINLLVSSYGLLLGATSNVLGNNVSADINQMVGLKHEGADAFIIGASQVGDEATYYDEVPYYIGGQLSNSRGEFDEPYVITINGTNVKAFSISFDTINNRHPRSIIVDKGTENEKIYYDDDAVYSLLQVPEADTHTITIENWNAPNYPLVITGIYADLEIEVEARNSLELVTNITDRESLTQPNWGIICNTAQLRFSDFGRELGYYAEQQLLKSGSRVEFVLTNTITKKTEPKGSFIIQKWGYDEISQIVNATLKDDLVEWQSINVLGLAYVPIQDSDRKARGFYRYLRQNTIENGNYEMPTFEELDEETQNVLENVTIPTRILYSDNLWSQWNKLCTICFLHIFKGEDGKIVCKYIGGN